MGLPALFRRRRMANWRRVARCTNRMLSGRGRYCHLAVSLHGPVRGRTIGRVLAGVFYLLLHDQARRAGRQYRGVQQSDCHGRRVSYCWAKWSTDPATELRARIMFAASLLLFGYRAADQIRGYSRGNCFMLRAIDAKLAQWGAVSSNCPTRRRGGRWRITTDDSDDDLFLVDGSIAALSRRQSSCQCRLSGRAAVEHSGLVALALRITATTGLAAVAIRAGVALARGGGTPAVWDIGHLVVIMAGCGVRRRRDSIEAVEALLQRVDTAAVPAWRPDRDVAGAA